MSISGGSKYQAERMTGANAPGESALCVKGTANATGTE